MEGQDNKYTRQLKSPETKALKQKVLMTCQGATPAWDSLVARMVKNLPAIQKTWV